MKIIFLILAIITLLLSGCKKPYFHMLNKDNPESESYYIHDDKDSISIEIDAAYYYMFDSSLNIEIGMLIENNSRDTMIIKYDDESLLSKHYSYYKRGRFPGDRIIVIYPKSKKEYSGIMFSYETRWPFLYNQKGWPKLPEDEEITFKLPTLIKGGRQITFDELHFIPPKE